VRKLFSDFQAAGENATATKGKLATRIIEKLTMKPDAERFDAKMTVLIENVTQHLDEEEQDWFPKVREGLSRTTLQEIGAAMIEVRKTAPRSPAQPSALKKVVDAVLG